MAVQASKPSFTEPGVAYVHRLPGKMSRSLAEPVLSSVRSVTSRVSTSFLMNTTASKACGSCPGKGGVRLLGVAETSPHLTDDGKRNHRLWLFGWRYGRLLRSLRHHVLAL